jgi:hypothetical protein
LRKSAATAGAVASAPTAASASKSFFISTPELLSDYAPLAAEDDQTTSSLLHRGYTQWDFAKTVLADVVSKGVTNAVSLPCRTANPLTISRCSSGSNS